MDAVAFLVIVIRYQTKGGVLSLYIFLRPKLCMFTPRLGNFQFLSWNCRTLPTLSLFLPFSLRTVTEEIQPRHVTFFVFMPTTLKRRGQSVLRRIQEADQSPLLRAVLCDGSDTNLHYPFLALVDGVGVGGGQTKL